MSKISSFLKHSIRNSTTNVTFEIKHIAFELSIFKEALERQQELEKDINTKASMLIFFLPFIILIGSIGNLLNIAIFSRKGFKNCSTFRFLIYLSVIDLNVLLFCASDAFLRFGFQIHIRQISTNLCRFHTFFTYLFTHASSTTLMVISIQRALVMTNKSVYLSLISLKKGQVIRKEPHSYFFGSSLCCILQFGLKSKIKKQNMYSSFMHRIDIIMATVLTFLAVLNIHYIFFMKLDWTSHVSNVYDFCFPREGKEFNLLG